MRAFARTTQICFTPAKSRFCVQHSYARRPDGCRSVQIYHRPGNYNVTLRFQCHLLIFERQPTVEMISYWERLLDVSETVLGPFEHGTWWFWERLLAKWERQLAKWERHLDQFEYGTCPSYSSGTNWMRAEIVYGVPICLFKFYKHISYADRSDESIKCRHSLHKTGICSLELVHKARTTLL